MLETKIVKSYSRECCSWLAKEHEEPPGNGSGDGEAGHAAQGRQRDLHRAGQPAGRRLGQPYTGRVLNLKRKTKFFSKEIFPPTTH